MAKKILPLKLKKVPDSGSSSDSGMWINVGEGFGYLPKIFMNSNHHHSAKEEDPQDDTQQAPC